MFGVAISSVSHRRGADTMGPGPAARYFTQAVDHFAEAGSAAAAATWQQAYFVNDTFFVPGSDAPVFLCVGGEGPLYGDAVAGSAHCNVAVEWLQEMGALMLAVEHRFYGCHNTSACPVAAPETDLRTLTSQQALADLAVFHAHASATFGLDGTRNKWVSWGGSYPGMLAGFVRAQYPQLIHAAVASSAPVHAMLDARVFNDVGAAAYGVALVGGSDACVRTIREGHAAAAAAVGSAVGRARLASLFPGLNGLLPRGGDAGEWLQQRVNARAFLGCGVASFPAQGNDPACTAPACNIGKICSIVTAPGGESDDNDALARLAAVAKAQGPGADGAQGCEMDWTFTEFSPPNTPGATGLAASGLYWGWQTCNEFGFYQTCEVGSGCFYAQGYAGFTGAAGEHRPNGFCAAQFGISEAATNASISASNGRYLPMIANASRIMWPNGEVDPWSGLGILGASPGKEQPVLMVAGASHHEWTHPSAPSDLKPVVAARAAIRKQVAAWLKTEN